MSTTANYEVLNWTQIYNMLLSQATRICQSGFRPNVIVGVSRGGWLPARVLSDLLENPNLANVRAECYESINKQKIHPILTQRISMEITGKSVLVVDEVADSGKSLRLVVNHAQELNAREVKTATLYYKTHSTLKPDYFEKTTSRWVVFPWETKETLRQIYEKNKNDPKKVEKEIEKLIAAGLPKRLITRFLNDFSEVKPC